MLHHVRTLVQTGFLVAEPDRAGAQGAREVPYRATGLSWRTPMPGGSLIMVETFLQQIAGLPPGRRGHHVAGAEAHRRAQGGARARMFELAQEFKERGPDADGKPYSLFTALHPDLNPPAAH